MRFSELLASRAERMNSLVCVGLDSDTEKIPGDLSQFEFNKAIVDATHDLVLAYKPNTAFYEAKGAKGIQALKDTCDYIKSISPDIPIVLDAKRADIGNTNQGYVKFAYDYLGADAITLHPYLGNEALSPFLNLPDKGAIILCRTSNSGSGEFQDEIFTKIATAVASTWNKNDNCSLVVGATYPEELKKVREIIGDDMWLLVPGVGVQGGNLESTLRNGLSSRGDGLIINSSRGIIFAESGDDFAMVARARTEELKLAINNFREGD